MVFIYQASEAVKDSSTMEKAIQYLVRSKMKQETIGFIIY